MIEEKRDDLPRRNWATATADQKKRAAAKGRKAVFAVGSFILYLMEDE